MVAKSYDYRFEQGPDDRYTRRNAPEDNFTESAAAVWKFPPCAENGHKFNNSEGCQQQRSENIYVQHGGEVAA